MLNKCQIIGHLGRDPEARHLPTGAAVTNFTVATSEKFKGKDGNAAEKTEWHACVAFGRLAEVCSQYLRKGSLIYLEGRLQTRTWEDKKSGGKRYKTEIVASTIKFLSKNEQGGGGGGDNYDYNQEAPVDEDSIPF